MRNNLKKMALITGVMSITLLSSSMTVPSVLAEEHAQTPADSSSKVAHHQPANHYSGRVPIQSSIQLTPEQMKSVHQAAMEAAQRKLRPMAKISARQADQAAEKEFPSAKIHQTFLQTVGRNLVYIVLLQRDTEKYLVVVDAGNGEILHKRSLTPPPMPAPSPSPTPSQPTPSHIANTVR